MNIYTSMTILSVLKWIGVGLFLTAAYFIPSLMGWLVFGAIMVALFGGYSVTTTSTAECPKCKHTFKISPEKGN